LGGGIGLVSGAGLRLVGSTVAGNQATGGPQNQDGGGIDGDSGALLIKRSRVVHNVAEGSGAGIYYFSIERSLITNSTIADNRLTSTGGGAGMYISPGFDQPPLRITRSTISGNRTPTQGGGLLVGSAKLLISNSTIAGNRAGAEGGGIYSSGDVTANAITVARNVSDSDSSGGELGGGLFYSIPAPGFDLQNSLIGLNRLGDGTRNDCAGDDFDSLGHNLVSALGPAGSCQGFDRPTDRVRGNPRIGRLRDNGGPTKTIALKQGSPAIGNAGHSAPDRDQRGRKRDRHPDIGAFER